MYYVKMFDTFKIYKIPPKIDEVKKISNIYYDYTILVVKHTTVSWGLIHL